MAEERIEAFTPGPWLYRPNVFDDWGFVRAGKPEGPLVATARAGVYLNTDEMNAHRANKTDPYEANARLISAAPELYEALARLLNPPVKAGPLGSINKAEAQIKEDLAFAHAALAKAEGRP